MDKKFVRFLMMSHLVVATTLIILAVVLLFLEIRNKERGQISSPYEENLE